MIRILWLKISGFTVICRLNKIIRINYQQIKSPLKLNQNWLLVHLIVSIWSFVHSSLFEWIIGILNWAQRNRKQCRIRNPIAVHSVAYYLIQLTKGNANYKRVYYNVYCYSLCVAVRGRWMHSWGGESISNVMYPLMLWHWCALCVRTRTFFLWKCRCRCCC